MRLQRAIARAGVASRRAAEDLIRGGRVRINGQVAEIGASVDPDRDTVTVAGRRVRLGRTVWIALNKPAGYAVTRRDDRGRATVFELVPTVPGLTYVGRLDVATAGLLLLTNDGEAAHRLTHPRYRVERSYRVLVRGRSPEDLRRALQRPVVVDGRPAQIVRYRVRAREAGASDVVMVLTEGRQRIVRRVCDRLGVKVDRLIRLSHGPVQLGRLAPGHWRHLTAGELRSIRGR